MTINTTNTSSNTNPNTTHVCGWCGVATTEEYCSTACHDACMSAYHKDMATMEQPSLMEAHGDVPMDTCPVCESRPVSNGMSTCLDTGCREQWSIAMAYCK